MSKGKFIWSALLGLTVLSSEAFSATYLGSWDLRGKGQADSVYRDGTAIKIVEPGGVTRSYPIGNVSWSLVDARNTDGKVGLELVIRKGNDLAIIDHAYQTQRNYAVGNFTWAVMEIIQLDSAAGEEILLSTPTGVRVIVDAQGSYRDIPFNYSGAWALFGVANLSGSGPDLVINMANGVKLIDPRTSASRDFTFPGYSTIFSISQLDSSAGLEVVGRTNGDVYVISGGVKSGRVKTYPATTSSAWAIYGRTADTDGKAGDEIILVMQGMIRIVRHGSGYVRDYPIPAVNYTIDQVTNLDGRTGNEILLRDSAGVIYVLNDRLGTITQQ